MKITSKKRNQLHRQQAVLPKKVVVEEIDDSFCLSSRMLAFQALSWPSGEVTEGERRTYGCDANQKGRKCS
jgi:hypothetical protein